MIAKKLICIVLSLFLLAGCAPRTFLKEGRYGTVMNVKKVAKKDIRPATGTLVGATVGGGAGAVVGSVVGFGATIVTFGLAAPIIPVFALMGAGSGAAIGAGGGYIYDYEKAGSGTYKYGVKLDKSNKLLTIVEVDEKPIPIKTKVCVFLERERLQISKKLSDCS